MTQLEAKLYRILQEHQQESGLHMIGGQRQLVARLLAFCEELLQEAAVHPEAPTQQHPTAGAA
jgi:ABC-type phosphate transport system ATPase subunit